jgi:CheY-like chemotaxis protein
MQIVRRKFRLAINTKVRWPSPEKWGNVKPAADTKDRRILLRPFVDVETVERAAIRIIMPITTLVSVVDDDESVRESLPDLLRAFGFAAEAFASAEEFLASDHLERTKCLILDVSMPGMSGPELRRALELQDRIIPTIFITAHVETACRSEVVEGSVRCLIKPFSDTQLLDALNEALGLR